MTTSVATKTAVGYFRVSSPGQTGERHSSLETQEDRFQEYCQRNNRLALATFVDVVTGRRDDRKEYLRMPHIRRSHRGEGAKRPEARCHPDGVGVDVAGIWDEGRASYPGRPAGLPPTTGVLPAPRGIGMGRRESAEAIVAAQPGGEGPNMECRTATGRFDDARLRGRPG